MAKRSPGNVPEKQPDADASQHDPVAPKRKQILTGNSIYHHGGARRPGVPLANEEMNKLIEHALKLLGGEQANKTLDNKDEINKVEKPGQSESPGTSGPKR